MKHLRTLTLSQCAAPHLFTRALDPRMSSLGVVVCPELEELVLVLRRNGETLDIKDVTDMAAGRASRGAKLKSVRIVSQGKFTKIDMLELEKHVLHMECGHEVDVATKTMMVVTRKIEEGNIGNGEQVCIPCLRVINSQLLVFDQRFRKHRHWCRYTPPTFKGNQGCTHSFSANVVPCPT